MNIKEQKEVVYSKALSIAEYGLALYAGQIMEIKAWTKEILGDS